MNVSSISSNRRDFFIKYANQFMNFKANSDGEATVTKPEIEPVKKIDKSMGIETLTIFPKQVVDGKMIITA